jgi:hypothetical protein
MQVDYIVCPAIIEEKLETKHRVTVREARQTLLNHPRIRFAEKGYIEDNDVYAAFGQSLGSLWAGDI